MPKIGVNNQTLLNVGGGEVVGDVSGAGSSTAVAPEALWFGTTTIHMTNVETVTTALTYSQVESPGNDMTLATSLGTSPSDTSSSSDTDDIHDAAAGTAASVPTGIALSSTQLMQNIKSQVFFHSDRCFFS